MNASQTRAIESFRRYMQTQLDTDPARQDTLAFDLQPTDYGIVWIKATTDMVGLPETNLLRYVARQHWFVKVGKRGALDVKCAPKSYEQFKGQRAFGMNFTF
jgi:hypothetical protein